MPKEVHFQGNNIAQEFFKRTFGVLGNSDTGERVFNTFLAISSLGNVIIMTFTAARMKQEIAKQGILPFAKFFAEDYDLSLGRLLLWMRRRGWMTSLLKHKWLAPESHQEKTPVGAFILHFGSCIVLILATSNLKPDDSYNVLTSAWVYLFPSFFGFLIAVGILILRFRGPPHAPLHPSAVPGAKARKQTWTEMTGRTFNPTVSIICAVIYALGCAYPVVVSWIPPSGTFADRGDVSWFVIPTIAVGVLGFASLWYLGFIGYAKRRETRRQQIFVIERHPRFEWAEDEDGEYGAGEDDESEMRVRAGGLILVHETVSLLWKGKDIHDLGALMEQANGANGGNDGAGVPKINVGPDQSGPPDFPREWGMS